MKRSAVLFLAAACLLSGAAAARPGARLTVAYTANSSGKMTVCGCPGDPYGGLVERVTLIKRLRAESEPFLLLDAGNMVSLFGDFDERAACVMRLMNLMGYDAAGVGRQEMFRCIAPARSMSGAANFPFLSATIADKNSRRPVFIPYIVKRIGDVRVGVTSVCDSTAYILDLNRVFDYSVIPLDTALKPVLDAMEGATDFIVVLSQMDTAKNEKLLRTYPSVDLVIEGSGNKALETQVSASRGVIVAPGGRSQYVGMITLEKDGSASPKVTRARLCEVLDIPADKRAGEIVRAYYRKER